jgi:hypothetical protein
METIEHELFRSVTVHLDGKAFVQCTFECCLLIYGGGNCEWEDSKFQNCQVVLEGIAHNVFLVLKAFGLVNKIGEGSGNVTVQ